MSILCYTISPFITWPAILIVLPTGSSSCMHISGNGIAICNQRTCGWGRCDNGTYVIALLYTNHEPVVLAKMFRLSLVMRIPACKTHENPQTYVQRLLSNEWTWNPTHVVIITQASPISRNAYVTNNSSSIQIMTESDSFLGVQNIVVW